jgi:hypothetical protein
MIQFAKETYHFMFKVIVIGDSGVEWVKLS